MIRSIIAQLDKVPFQRTLNIVARSIDSTVQEAALVTHGEQESDLHVWTPIEQDDKVSNLSVTPHRGGFFTLPRLPKKNYITLSNTLQLTL